MRDEVAAGSPPARSFSDSVIDLSSMETVPAEHLPSGGEHAEDDPSQRVEALRAGDRLRIFLHGRWSRVQLLWRSDRSLFFLFAGESPTRTHSITRRALERLSSAGLMQPLEARSLVQRAVDRMMRDICAAQPDLSAASSRSISAAIVAGCSWIDPVRGVRQRAPAAARGTNASSPSSSDVGRAMSSSAQMTSVGTRTVTASGAKRIVMTGLSRAVRRAQRRGAVVVAAAAQAGIPDLAVLLAHRLGQPAAAGARRVGRAHVGEERPEPGEVVLGQQRLGVRPAEEVHVGARRLLFGVVLQAAEKGRRMRRVDDHQAAQPSRLLAPRGSTPRRRPSRAPPGPRRCAAELVDERGDVGDQMLGAIGLDLGRAPTSRS